jgi:hypothetical protein
MSDEIKKPCFLFIAHRSSIHRSALFSAPPARGVSSPLKPEHNRL